MSGITITELVFTPAAADEQAGGLLGFVRFVLDDRVAINGVTLRRSSTKRLYLGWPRRADRHRIDHFLVQPVEVHRSAIEAAVMRALAAAVEAAR